jgi:hypothetical protein
LQPIESGRLTPAATPEAGADKPKGTAEKHEDGCTQRNETERAERFQIKYTRDAPEAQKME